MFTNNKFGKFDAVADAIKNIAEADYKAKMEELKGQQHKIDKNKNNKIDAHDFAILRGEKKGMKKEETEQIDEISSTLANKYLNAPQGKGANKYKVGDTGTTKKNIYPDAETMSKHSKSVRQAIQRSGSSSIFKKPSYYKEEAEQIDEEINVKKDYDDHEQSEHGVYKGKRKIGYIVHNKKAGTHTAYHGHKYGKDDYENSDDFKSHEHALNQIKKSAGINESNNPFDLKNYKSQLPTKPGEKAGFDSKKISTGTVYSRKPVKDEPMKKEEIDPNDTTTDTLKGREKTSGNPFLSKKVKMDVPDNVKEEAEQVDEATMTHITLGQKVKNSDGGHKQDVHYKGKKIGSIESYKHRTGLRYGGKHDATGEEEAGSRSPEEAINFVRNTHAEHLKGMKEEVERIDEGKMDHMSLSHLWHRHAHHTYLSDQGYGSGSGSMHHNAHAATAIENHVRKKYGNKVADDMVAHSDNHVAHAEYVGGGEAKDVEHAAEKLRKKHGIKGDLYGMHNESVDQFQERTLTPGETTEKERIVKGMKKSLAGFKQRYGEKAKSVMYATATKAAKKD